MMEMAIFAAGMTSGVAMIKLFVNINRSGEQAIERMRQQWEAGSR